MNINDSELLWKLADYRAKGVEPSERVVDNPGLCEGEMMSDGEIEDYVAESLKVLSVMNDQGSSRFEEVKSVFLVDMRCLLELGRIGLDEYNDLIDPDNFSI